MDASELTFIREYNVIVGCCNPPTISTSTQLAAPRLGNVLLVDIVNGKDSTASPGGLPYQTIQAAVSASRSGDTIYVLPGTYTLPLTGITLKPNTCLRGINLQTVILQMIPVASGFYTAITMGTQTRLEDVTINMTTSANNAYLTGIYFPGTTTTSAKIRTCVLNVSSTAGGTANIFGIFSDGTTVNPATINSINAVQRLTTNVTSNTTGIVRGWYFTDALQFSVRDTVVFATAVAPANNVIGVETINANSLIIIKTSTISGTTNDILQPSLSITDRPVINLYATDLVNATSGLRGFGVNTVGSQIQFGVVGNINDGVYYLTPGTSVGSTLLTQVFSIPFTNKCILFGFLVYSQISLIDPGDTFKIELFNTTTPTVGGSGTQIGLSQTLTSSTKIIRSQNFSSMFDPSIPNYLQVRLTTNGLNSGYSTNSWFIVLSLY